ncbi:MAG TPA: hypothetical protein VF125_02420 [Solirubrobacterales bacterium]
MSHVEFYPYRTAADCLELRCECDQDDVVVEERRVLMQNVPDDSELTLRLHVFEQSNPLETVLPEQEHSEPPLRTLVIARSLGSRFRRSITLAKNDQGAWTGELKLAKRDVFGWIELEPVMIRTAPGNDPGFAGHVGARLAWGPVVVALLDDPPTSAGQYLDIRWDDFKKTANPWRREHGESLYLLDVSADPPELWLNEAIPRFKPLAHTTGRRGRDMRVRNATFALIAAQVWTSLIGAVTTNLARLTQDDPELDPNHALEWLSDWETRVVNQWSPQLFPDAGSRQEAVEELVALAASPQEQGQLQQRLVPQVLKIADATRSFAGLIRLRDGEGV